MLERLRFRLGLLVDFLKFLKGFLKEYFSGNQRNDSIAGCLGLLLILTVLGACGWLTFRWIYISIGWEYSLSLLLIIIIGLRYVLSQFRTLSKEQYLQSTLNPILIELSDPATYENPQRRLRLCEKGITLAGVPHSYAKQWEKFHFELGTTYLKMTEGNRAENIEKAIEAYDEVFKSSGLLTEDSDDLIKEYIPLIINYGEIFRRRINGDLDENKAIAIKVSEMVLMIISQDESPFEWAVAQSNLATSLMSNDYEIQAQSDNIERAINACQAAIPVLMEIEETYHHTLALMSLGHAYYFRVEGKRADNLELAIESFEKACQFFWDNRMLFEWVSVMNNLSNAYRDRVLGDIVQNIEQAIFYSQEILKQISFEQMPIEWAISQMNLGCAYLLRERGNKSDNLEKAIQAYEIALSTDELQAIKSHHINLLLNLGNAYTDARQRDNNEKVKQGIEYYRAALLETNPGSSNWLKVNLNLGLALGRKTVDAPKENLDEAIRIYEQLLDHTDQNNSPLDWARVMYNLGTIYAYNEQEELAKQCFLQALEVFTLDTSPYNYREIWTTLGLIYVEQKEWTNAYQAFLQALTATEKFFLTSNTLEARYIQLSKLNIIPYYLAFCSVRLGLYEDALMTLEKARTRSLRESLLLQGALLTGVQEEDQALLHDVSRRINGLDNETRNIYLFEARDFITISAELQSARTELITIVQKIRDYQPDFLAFNLELTELLSLIPEGGVLVTYYVTFTDAAFFVIPYGTDTVTSDHLVSLKDFIKNDFDYLLWGWFGSYSNYLREHQQILEIYIASKHLDNPETKYHFSDGIQESLLQWQGEIRYFTRRLGEIFMDPLQKRLRTLELASGASILVIPQQGIGLLPLHAAWQDVDDQRQYFIDEYNIIYIPSGYTQGISQRKAKQPERQKLSLLAVINPSNDLRYAPIEGEIITSLFSDTTQRVLLGDEASLSNVREVVSDYAYLHFSCHGSYNWHGVMQSGLQLANGENLTLADIIGNFNLNRNRLVVLSACETGMIDISQSPDEHIGLPAGFLQAGAPAVISTLWAVNDLSTMLLMERFYHYHIKDGVDIAPALREAQLWLRDVTARELALRFRDERKELLGNRITLEQSSEYWRRFAALEPNSTPFEHPYHWAAFTFTGA